jgi:Ca2+-binding EF-hand superfamily protein
MKMHAGHALKRMELEAAIFILDADDDGKITKEEFLHWWEASNDMPTAA